MARGERTDEGSPSAERAAFGPFERLRSERAKERERAKEKETKKTLRVFPPFFLSSNHLFLLPLAFHTVERKKGTFGEVFGAGGIRGRERLLASKERVFDCEWERSPPSVVAKVLLFLWWEKKKRKRAVLKTGLAARANSFFFAAGERTHPRDTPGGAERAFEARCRGCGEQ